MKLKELRHAMETQFRYKFYNSTEFPFLPSMGIRHILQGFEAPNKEIGYIGMLHLWWVNEDSGIEYDNPRYFVKGTWNSEWLDTPQEGLKLAIKLQAEQAKVYDENKLWEVHIRNNEEIKRKMMTIKEGDEEKELDNEEKIVYN